MVRFWFLLLLTLVPAGASHAAEFITNGHFNAGLTGFTVVGTAAASGADYVQFAGGSGSSTAQANMFAAFGAGNVGGTDTLSQSIQSIAGKLYTLSFDYGGFGTGQAVELFVGGVSVATYTGDGSMDLDSVFTTATYSFTGTGAPMEILFVVQAGDIDNMDALIDNISVTAVPEAATWVMLITGFGMIGVASRRRQSSVRI